MALGGGVAGILATLGVFLVLCQPAFDPAVLGARATVAILALAIALGGAALSPLVFVGVVSALLLGDLVVEILRSGGRERARLGAPSLAGSE